MCKVSLGEVNESNSLSESMPMRLTKLLASKYTIAAMVLAVLMYLMSAHPAFAQTAYTPPASLNSFPAAAVPSWLDTGSNAWMMTAGTFVGLQSIPGLSLYYGGLTRKKFSINTALMCFYGFSIVLVVWVLAGYNFGFGRRQRQDRQATGSSGTFSSVAPGLTEGSQAVVGPAGLALNIPTVDGRLVPVRLRRDHAPSLRGRDHREDELQGLDHLRPSVVAPGLQPDGLRALRGRLAQPDGSGGLLRRLRHPPQRRDRCPRLGDRHRSQGAKVQRHQAQQPLLGLRRLRPGVARLERVQRRRPIRLQHRRLDRGHQHRPGHRSQRRRLDG